MAMEPRNLGGFVSGRDGGAAGSSSDAGGNIPPHSIEQALKRSLGPNVPVPASAIDVERVEALLHIDEAAALRPEESAQFSTTAASGVSIPVRWDGAAPLPWDGATSRVRFRTAQAVGLERGAVGWLTLDRATPPVIVVPTSAVLAADGKTFVLAWSSEQRSFARRQVAIGRVTSGLAAVSAGLAEGDAFVSMNVFVLDAESRRRGGRLAPATK
jgi:hypothetical protein